MTTYSSVRGMSVMEYDVYPWRAWKRIYDRDGVEILETTSPSWVIKYQHSRYSTPKEIDFLRNVYEKGPLLRNMVELPSDPEKRFGINWYAMRKYAGAASSDISFASSHWRRLGCDVLNFLEDLHHLHNSVHLDIVLRNIFIDRDNDRFVVGDFELMVHMPGDSDPVLTHDEDTVWYYIGAGAEISRPLHSWRMDLVMLGYCLAELTGGPRQFASLCQKRRSDRHMSTSDYDIIQCRNKEMLECDPTVRAYLDRVAELVPWNTQQAPAASVYEELRACIGAQRNHTTFSEEGGAGSSDAGSSSPS